MVKQFKPRPLLTILLLLTVLNITAQKVSFNDVQEFAQNKIEVDNKNNYSITYYEEHTIGENLSYYVFKLTPKGYMICTNRKDLPPVIAYSYTNNLDSEGRLLSLVRTDLVFRSLNLELFPELKDKKELWQTNTTKGGFEQWPAEGTTSSGGWLECNWSQNAPYNNMCPMDPVDHARSIAGCPSIAMGMILFFHKTVNGVFFDDDDDYYHNYAGRQYWIDDDHIMAEFPSFPDLNLYLDTVQNHFNDETDLTDNDLAAITFACGVAATQVYTSSASGTFGVSQAYDAYMKFNFDEVQLLTESDTNLYSIIIQNIKDTLPVHLAVVDEAWSMGHNVVIDGYNTDEYYHLNFGWGGASNGWYLLPDGIPYSLTVVEGAIVDIIPDNTVSVVSEVSPEIIIYPNPSYNHIYLKNLNSNFQIFIYNIDGKRVLTDSFDQQAEIDISELTEGTYIIRVLSEKKTYTKKLIKL